MTDFHTPTETQAALKTALLKLVTESLLVREHESYGAHLSEFREHAMRAANALTPCSELSVVLMGMIPTAALVSPLWRMHSELNQMRDDPDRPAAALPEITRLRQLVVEVEDLLVPHLALSDAHWLRSVRTRTGEARS